MSGSGRIRSPGRSGKTESLNRGKYRRAASVPVGKERLK